MTIPTRRSLSVRIPTKPYRTLGALWLGAVGILPAPPVYALLANCSVTTTGISFGAYHVYNPTPTDSTGTITVSCTGLLLSLLESYTIQISQGGSGSFVSRLMASGSQRLAYNLYTDPTYTTVWGDGSAGTGTVSDSYLLGLFTVTRRYTVYGRIPAGQNARAGNYGDTVVVTVNYN